METEKVIQINKDKVLTNKGRIFERVALGDGDYDWWEIKLPMFLTAESDSEK